MAIQVNSEPTNYKLNVKVMEKNNLFSDQLIGEAEISMSEHFGKEQVFTTSIFNPKNLRTSTGTVTLRLLLHEWNQDDPLFKPQWLEGSNVEINYKNEGTWFDGTVLRYTARKCE